MRLTDTARVKLLREFIDVYGYGPTLSAIGELMRHEADGLYDVADSHAPDSDEYIRRAEDLYRTAAAIPSIQG